MAKRPDRRPMNCLWPGLFYKRFLHFVHWRYLVSRKAFSLGIWLLRIRVSGNMAS